MKTENIYCDYCNKMTTQAGKKLESLNGFCIEIGHSKGGWGSRKDFIGSHSVEICNDCFNRVSLKATELVSEIFNCKNKKQSLPIQQPEEGWIDKAVKKSI